MTGRDTPASIAIVGAGSWGTALAVHLGRRGHPVRLWVRDADLADRIRALGANPRYLPDVRLPPRVTATSSSADALADAALVIVAVPSRFLGQVAALVAPSVPPAALVVSATKGIERRRTLRMSEVLAAALPGRPVAVLSGPSFAREVAFGKPTAVVVAADDTGVALRVQRELATPEFRVYTNRDVVGVEVAGALKNVIAIAAGLSDSLELGDNARAALITRGLAEIVRLGVGLGASPRTFAGLAGLGDLLLTCTGTQSRNRSLGLSVGRGEPLEEVERATPMVAEGVETVVSALAIAGRIGVPMPICEAVSAVLFERQPAADALAGLLAREPRPEEDPVVTLPSPDALSARGS